MSGSQAELDAVRAYWNVHVADWKIATAAPGTPEFFAQTEAYRFEKLHYLPRVVQFAGYAGKRLLDVGCGLGNDAARFAKGGARVTCIDLAPRAIELARANFQQRGLAADFHVMDGESMSFEDDAFDVVYCHTVLQFTPRAERMLKEIARVVRPGGTAIIMAINRSSWFNLLRGIMKLEVDYLDAPVFRRYTVGEFRRLLEPAFKSFAISTERFPVATKVHFGSKAFVYNKLFVGGFNSLPRALVRNTGHHLLAFCSK